MMGRAAGGRAWAGRIPMPCRHGFANAVLDASNGNIVFARDAGGWASATTVEETYGHADLHDPAFDGGASTVLGASSDRAEGPGGPGCRPGQAGPAGAADGADDGAGIRPALPQRPDRDPAPASGLPLGVRGGGLRAGQEGRDGLCQEHRLEWRQAREAGSSRAAFLAAASPWPRRGAPGALHDLPRAAVPAPVRPLCGTHHGRWRHAGQPRNEALQEWLREQTPFPGYGSARSGLP